MAFARLPRQQRLALGVTAVVGVVAVMGLWLLAGLTGAPRVTGPAGRQATATVVTTASCQGQDAHDRVSVSVDGRDLRLMLDGCGHPEGQKLTVLVPDSVTGATLVEPGSAALGDSAGLVHRVAFLLLAVSAAAGGVCAYLLMRISGRPLFRFAGWPRPGGGGESRPTAVGESRPATVGESRPAAESSVSSALTDTNWFGDAVTSAMDPLRPTG